MIQYRNDEQCRRKVFPVIHSTNLHGLGEVHELLLDAVEEKLELEGDVLPRAVGEEAVGELHVVEDGDGGEGGDALGDAAVGGASVVHGF